MTSSLQYLTGYPTALQEQVQQLIDKGGLGAFLLEKYPTPHQIGNNRSLREYVMELKNRFMKKANPLSTIAYDNKIHVVHNALGLHTLVSRRQGSKMKRKNEIRISTTFKKAPEELLNMIVVHELAHLKEMDHNKSFYRLCEHMLPDYDQLELDMRLYITQLDIGGAIYA
jgi:predicted metal-dependent hydrolase